MRYILILLLLPLFGSGQNFFMSHSKIDNVPPTYVDHISYSSISTSLTVRYPVGSFTDYANKKIYIILSNTSNRTFSGIPASWVLIASSTTANGSYYIYEKDVVGDEESVGAITLTLSGAAVSISTAMCYDNVTSSGTPTNSGVSFNTGGTTASGTIENNKIELRIHPVYRFTTVSYSGTNYVTDVNIGISNSPGITTFVSHSNPGLRQVTWSYTGSYAGLVVFDLIN